MWSIATVAADPQSTHEILVTLAERPHPFPSRTRKLSSPAPKILRGQPFGKIGRRRDLCVSACLDPAPPVTPTSGERTALSASRGLVPTPILFVHDVGRVPTDRSARFRWRRNGRSGTAHLPVPVRLFRRRCLACRDRDS